MEKTLDAFHKLRSVDSIFLSRFSIVTSLLILLFCVCPARAEDITTLSIGSVQNQEQTHTVDLVVKSIKLIPDDLAKIAAYPLDHPHESLIGALTVGGLILFDKPITQFYQDKIGSKIKGSDVNGAPIFSKINIGPLSEGADSWVLFTAGATYLGGLVVDDLHAQETGIAATKAIVYSTLVTQLILKTITARNRPIDFLSTGKSTNTSYTSNPYDFGNFHGPELTGASGTSLPSFHFTMYFAVATVFYKAYDSAIIPYSIAAAGLISDVQFHHHWVSDMVAGALVGTIIGNVVADNSYRHDDKKIHIEPIIGLGNGASGGLQLTKYF